MTFSGWYAAAAAAAAIRHQRGHLFDVEVQMRDDRHVVVLTNRRSGEELIVRSYEHWKAIRPARPLPQAS